MREQGSTTAQVQQTRERKIMPITGRKRHRIVAIMHLTLKLPEIR